jgi:hypothetical protein
VFGQLEEFVQDNNAGTTVKKELIFGYPPIQFKDTETILESLSSRVKEENLLESQIATLWNMLGKHIYGKSSPHSQNQL